MMLSTQQLHYDDDGPLEEMEEDVEEHHEIEEGQEDADVVSTESIGTADDDDEPTFPPPAGDFRVEEEVEVPGADASPAATGEIEGERAFPGSSPQMVLLSQLTASQKILILSLLIRERPREASAAAAKVLQIPPPGVRLYADDALTGGIDQLVGEDLQLTKGDGTPLAPARKSRKVSSLKIEPPYPLAMPPATPNAEGGPKKRASWDQMLEKLHAYKLIHGDCRIPTKYPPDPPLGRWVDNQRQAYRRYNEGRGATWLTPERIIALEEVGFEWKVATYDFRRWEDWLDDLVKFRDKHGHTRVSTVEPSSAAFKKSDAAARIDDVSAKGRLGLWCAHQREHYKRYASGLKSQLTPERIAALDDLDFEWVVRPPVTHTFADRIQQLAKFKEDHGHVNVPLSVKDGRRSLGSWAADMRTQYQKRLKGEKTSLSDERIAKLTMLGFSFIKDYGPQRSWAVRFDELRKFTEVNGHCNPTIDQDKTLFIWCRKQREGYRRMKKGLKTDIMTEERALKLDSIGFDFSAPKRGRPKKADKAENADGDGKGGGEDTAILKQPKPPKLDKYSRPAPLHWETKFAQLRAFHFEHGNCHATPRNSSVALQRWCQRQREQYALWIKGGNSTMSADKIRKLGTLDFPWQSRPSGRPWHEESPTSKSPPAAPLLPRDDDTTDSPENTTQTGKKMNDVETDEVEEKETKKTRKDVGGRAREELPVALESKNSTEITSKKCGNLKRKKQKTGKETSEPKAKRAKCAPKTQKKKRRARKLPSAQDKEGANTKTVKEDGQNFSAEQNE